MLARRFVSPPLVAPHPSGAAVDLTLVDTDGVELDMGTPVDATPEASDGACYTDAANLTSMARANRRILSVALTAVGLINYPTEWWHWSYGDRYWAMSVQAAHAHYGPVDDPGATR
jgi:D-alanyl-D-alanine dipeptidase